MRLIALGRSLWSNIVRRREVEHALDAELRAYVDLLAADYERSGLAPDVARRRALVETGGLETVKDAVRDAWAGDALATISREMRYTLRTLRRAPAFLGIAVGTLATGIGGATAVFTVIKGSLLRPLPAVADPDRLVTVERVDPTTATSESGYPVFQLSRLPRPSRTDDGADGDRWVRWRRDGGRGLLGLGSRVGQLRH